VSPPHLSIISECDDNAQKILVTEEAMSSIYKASYVSLHVRRSNTAAIGLYKDTLGFEVQKIEKKYCRFIISAIKFILLIIGTRTTDGDGEDALSMRLSLKQT
jgi:peptide alpha-N-acetyltransferase